MFFLYNCSDVLGPTLKFVVLCISDRLLKGSWVSLTARKDVRNAAYELYRIIAKMITTKKAILVEFCFGSFDTPER